jgi:hypothetical protein
MAGRKRENEIVKNYLAAIGRKGGAARAEALTPSRRKQIAASGGRAAATKRTPEERRAAALKAIRARWAKHKRRPGKKGGKTGGVNRWQRDP